MFINNKSKCIPINGASSEKIYELLGRATGNSNDVSIAYLELPPNASTPKHYHPDMAEVYYVLEGSGQLIVNNEVREIIKNDTAFIEKQKIHQLINHTDKILHLLTVSTPAWAPESEVIVS